jgi:xanthine dehydrogenase accessory factor
MSPDRQAAIWHLALSSLRQDLPVVLLYVLESRGSSPGRQGFFMVVNARGETEGSIGGGIMEHKFTELARDRLQQNDHSLSLRRQIHDKDVAKDRSGMICSGQQTILIYPFSPGDLLTVQAILDSLADRRNGTLQLSPAGLSFSSLPPEKDFQFDKTSEEDWRYQEKTGYRSRLFIIGGGHCGLALSRLMRTMDFHITIVDHRPGLPTLVLNEAAHEKVLVADYEELRQSIPADRLHHYLVVMTQGYRTDDRAVRALLEKEFRYFGLLGSRTKAGKLMADYRAEGIAEDALKKIHTPAGLSINSQTPEEIAISIAAQIIQVKNQ